MTLKTKNHVRKVQTLMLIDRTVRSALGGTEFTTHTRTNPARVAFHQLGREIKKETVDPHYVVQMFWRDSRKTGGIVAIHDVYFRVRFGKPKSNVFDEYRIHVGQDLDAMLAQLFEIISFAARQHSAWPWRLHSIKDSPCQ